MNNPAVVPFYFQENEIRSLADEQGNPLFVAKDMVKVLGYSNTSDAINRHCKGVVKYYPLLTSGGMQELRVIYEPDLYRLIAGSQLPSAIEFEKWIFEEVLPKIRKTGSYSLAGQSALDSMTAQIIQMVVPAVIGQATTAIVGQIAPQLEGLQRQVNNVQINFSHTGTVWSFSYHCLQEGSTNAYVEKDVLYKAYCDYCSTLSCCHPEAKPGFLSKLYRAFVNTHAAHIGRFGRKVPVVRGITLLPGYAKIIEDLRRRRQESDAAELARRREVYCGVVEGREVQ